MHKQVIALIDDDRNILTSLSIALEKEGFKVQTYIDGESALIGLTRTPPDLAIVDIKMPKICLLYTSPSPRDTVTSRMPSSA